MDANLHDGGAEEDVPVIVACAHIVGVGGGGAGCAGGAVGVGWGTRGCGAKEAGEEEEALHGEVGERGWSSSGSEARIWGWFPALVGGVLGVKVCLGYPHRLRGWEKVLMRVTSVSGS